MNPTRQHEDVVITGLPVPSLCRRFMGEEAVGGQEVITSRLVGSRRHMKCVMTGEVFSLFLQGNPRTTCSQKGALEYSLGSTPVKHLLSQPKYKISDLQKSVEDLSVYSSTLLVLKEQDNDELGEYLYFKVGSYSNNNQSLKSSSYKYRSSFTFNYKSSTSLSSKYSYTSTSTSKSSSPSPQYRQSSSKYKHYKQQHSSTLRISRPDSMFRAGQKTTYIPCDLFQEGGI